MARFIPSAFLSSIKGKVGHTVFQANAAGHFIRTLGNTRINSSTGRQQMNKILSDLHHTWLQLISSDQQLWAAFAIYADIRMKNNSSKIINGYNCFIKINIPRVIYGHSVLLTPLSSNDVPFAANFSLRLIAPVLYLSCDRLLISSNEFMFISISPPIANGITYNNKKYLQLLIPTTDADTWDITTLYSNLFGKIPDSGQNISLKTSLVSLLSGLQQPFTFQITQI